MIRFYTEWDEFKDARMCNAWVAAAVIGAGALGAGATIYGANKAASAQKGAVDAATAAQLQMYNQTNANLAPYRNIGSAAADELTANNYYTAPIDVTKELQNPDSTAAKAYDFTKTQGLKAVQNSAAARGLGVSGAALKGAANFTTGLADNTYTNLFNLANTNQTNAYNRLKGLVDTGENAAAGTGAAATVTGQGLASSIIGGGNAAAAAANTTGGALSSFANNAGGYAAYKGLYGSNTGGANGTVNSLLTTNPNAPIESVI